MRVCEIKDNAHIINNEPYHREVWFETTLVTNQSRGNIPTFRQRCYCTRRDKKSFQPVLLLVVPLSLHLPLLNDLYTCGIFPP